jgi:hypothetical protein
MTKRVFDAFWAENKTGLVELLRSVQLDIEDGFGVEGIDGPCVEITISVDADCTTWVYQTGDNSFTGACYHHPYWGVGYITRDDDSAEIAADLIHDLETAIDNWE